MIEQPNPTRAEVSDVFNAVYDGADATMLSAESASGKYPVEAVKAMANICREAESHQQTQTSTLTDRLDLAIGSSAVAAATQGLQAKALILITVSYELALHVSKLRPSCPIIIITFSSKLAAVIDLCFACHCIVLKEPKTSSSQSSDQLIVDIENAIKARSWLQQGDLFVLACGDAPLPGLRHSLQLGEFGTFGANLQNKKSKWSHLIEQHQQKEQQDQQDKISTPPPASGSSPPGSASGSGRKAGDSPLKAASRRSSTGSLEPAQQQ